MGIQNKKVTNFFLWKTQLLKMSKRKMEDCSICLQNLDTGTCKIRCGHVFHQTCINELEASDCNQSCPLCRHPFPKKATRWEQRRILHTMLTMLKPSLRSEDPVIRNHAQMYTVALQEAIMDIQEPNRIRRIC